MPSNPAKSFLPTIFRRFRSKVNEDLIRSARDNPRKVLLVKQSERLGNIALMNSAILGLAAAFPGVQIDFLLPAAYADVMLWNSHVSRIVPAQKRRYIARPWELAGLIRRLRGQKYDLAIDCSDINSQSSTGALHTILSGAHVTAGWRSGQRPRFDIEVARYSETVHAVEMYLRLISGIFDRQFRGEPYFDRYPSRNNTSDSVVGINCGGRGPKRWPLDNFLEVGARLSKQGINVEFILGPEEKRLRERFEHMLPERCRLLPPMALSQLMERVVSYKAFVSSDTGPMHLAWCLRVPTVAIFLDSELEKFRPLSPGSVALDCGNGVTADDVFNAAMKMLASRQVPA